MGLRRVKRQAARAGWGDGAGESKTAITTPHKSSICLGMQTAVGEHLLRGLRITVDPKRRLTKKPEQRQSQKHHTADILRSRRDPSYNTQPHVRPRLGG